jgi:hypothetical protein
MRGASYSDLTIGSNLLNFVKYLIIVIVGLSLSVVFSSSSFILTTVFSLVFLTLTYSYTYWKNGIDAKLAYWLIFYAGFGITLLGIGLLQTHAECLNLIGECYSRRLPPWLVEFKIIWKGLLSYLNAAAIIVSVLKILAANQTAK